MIQIIDDDSAMRAALEQLLKAEGYKTHTFGSASEFLASRPDLSADCVVLDVLMRGIGGMELQRIMAEQGNPLPVIFLASHATIPLAVQAMKAGAVDFLMKPMQKAELLCAVKTAIERRQIQREIEAERQDLRDRLARLTPRERDVFTFVARGWLNKEIAAAIGTGVQNVKIHRGQVMRKMQVVALADLVKIAQEFGICSQSRESAQAALRRRVAPPVSENLILPVAVERSMRPDGFNAWQRPSSERRTRAI